MSKELASQILLKHEDSNEFHFHEVDRKWIIDAMIEYSSLNQEETSDEEIEKAIVYDYIDPYTEGFINGAKWYREQLKKEKYERT